MAGEPGMRYAGRRADAAARARARGARSASADAHAAGTGGDDDDDDGEIYCVGCGVTVNDGEDRRWIACDTCSRWMHMECVLPNVCENAPAPERFVCAEFIPRYF